MLQLKLPYFDIDQIADSGQCFRMYRIDDHAWEVHALNEVLVVNKSGIEHQFFCSDSQFYDFWWSYFDLDTDYSDIIQRVENSQDGYLCRAVRFSHGIRILRQNLWEVIVSFVISQQNNISRIKKCIANLCRLNNNKFPMPEDILRWSDSEWDSLKLGYRTSYLKAIANEIYEKKFDVEVLSTMSCKQSVLRLKRLHGVGDKVANCIALFGLHKLDAFPVDVWIKRIIDTYYEGYFNVSELRLGDVGGVVQQYMFFYERNVNSKANDLVVFQSVM